MSVRLDTSGDELKMLRDVVIRAHQMTGGAYIQTAEVMMARTHRLLEAAVAASPAMSGFLGRGGTDAHRDILQGSGDLSVMRTCHSCGEANDGADVLDATDLPESLRVSPNIPWENQTLEQLRAERDYWESCIRKASGFASAKAADDFRRGCEGWITRRQSEL
jgi:hypothetical protein